MNEHVSTIVHTFHFEQCRQASINRFQTNTTNATLVSVFVISGIDYCNSLLFGSTHHAFNPLARIQNYTVGVILRIAKSANITTNLRSIHWLPVKVRSTYKIACLCYHCHNSTTPSYFADMLQKNPLCTRNNLSSSHTMPLLYIHVHSRATLGDRLLSLASSWNFTPNEVRCVSSLSPFVTSFLACLFRSNYKD